MTSPSPPSTTMLSSPTTTVAPRPVQERSLLPDVLRGVALLGILCVNMQDFAAFSEWQQRGIDRAAQVLTDILANGRFISLFAMLFGWGAAGLIRRHGPRLFLRRHLVLLLVGALHFVLVWHGDIISLYAVAGLSLLALAGRSERVLLGTALVCGGSWLADTLWSAAQSLSYGTLERSGTFPDLSAQATYPALVAGRAAEFPGELWGGALYNGPWLIALFCLGAAAYRSGVLARPQEHVPLLQKLARWGTTLGLLLGMVLAWLNTRPDYASSLFAIPVRMGGGLAGGLGYVGLIGLLTVQGRLGLLRPFAQSGRIAMSNYLAQSLVMTTVFYPYAGAQWGRWGAAATLGLALAFGLLQVWLSGLIVRRSGSGPLERLVRRLVYAVPAARK
ncbi:DUF418 domain-containing protein [Deinococcus sp.]|uniref:DUF418 domain-containing protein n=1 Tax=Deinococcus sp. TaxID=47478 RepID=UPI0025C2FA6D|nr:DUF418 domain-containing protein [Deinococcus sp.]